MGARTLWIISALIYAAALGCAALFGRKALIIMSAVIPLLVIRSTADIWIWDQQRQKKPVNAIAIGRWAMAGMCLYGALATLAVVIFDKWFSA